jgi:hypothetical protein
MAENMKCILTIAGMKDKEIIGTTIDNFFSGENYDSDDYIEIISKDTGNIIFTKRNYNQIENMNSNRNIKIKLIADFIRSRGKSPLQGILFE